MSEELNYPHSGRVKIGARAKKLTELGVVGETKAKKSTERGVVGQVRVPFLAPPPLTQSIFLLSPQIFEGQNADKALRSYGNACYAGYILIAVCECILEWKK